MRSQNEFYSSTPYELSYIYNGYAGAYTPTLSMSDENYDGASIAARGGIDFFTEAFAITDSFYGSNFVDSNLNTGRYWYQASSAITNNYDLELGRAIYKAYDGSSLLLTNSATGQYLTPTFDANAAGTSALSTSINYVGKDFNSRIEETMAGRVSEIYVATIGQKANADGVPIGLNTFQKTTTSGFAYKDGINTAARQDNITAISNQKTVETQTSNISATADVLGESYSEVSSSSVSLGGGSTDAYSQKVTLSYSYTGTQTFNADSSIAETSKESEVYTSQFNESASDYYDTDGDDNFSEVTFTQSAVRKDSTSDEYASSVNINGDYKETSKETWDHKITSTNTELNSDGSKNQEDISLSVTGSSSYLLDEQKAINEETESASAAVVFSYLSQNLTTKENIKFDIAATATGKTSVFSDGKNNADAASISITKLTYSEDNDFTNDSTVNPIKNNGNAIDVVASATYSSGTDKNGAPIAEVMNVIISTGSLTKVNEDGTTNYTITTAKTTLNSSSFSVLESFETLALQADLDNIQTYLDTFQTAADNQEEYFPVGYGGVGDMVKSTFNDYYITDSFEHLILLGDNTITIKDVGGAIVNGGLGADTIKGGIGDDDLEGGRGADIMDGGLGDDVYYLDQYSGSDFGVAGKTFTGFDTITFSASGTNGTDSILFTDTADLVTALNPSGLKSTAFKTVDSIATYLNTLGLITDSTSVIYVTDTVAKQGAIYYVENVSTNAVTAAEIKLLGITTGDFSTDFTALTGPV